MCPLDPQFVLCLLSGVPRGPHLTRGGGIELAQVLVLWKVLVQGIRGVYGLEGVRRVAPRVFQDDF